MTEHFWWLLLSFFNNLIPFEVLILGLNVIDANGNSFYQFRKYFQFHLAIAVVFVSNSKQAASVSVKKNLWVNIDGHKCGIPFQELLQGNQKETKIYQIIRSSHRRCSIKKGILNNFTKFTGKHLCQGLFLHKIAGLRPAALLKKRLWNRFFPTNFVKFLRTSFFT